MADVVLINYKNNTADHIIEEPDMVKKLVNGEIKSEATNGNVCHENGVKNGDQNNLVNGHVACDEKEQLNGSEIQDDTLNGPTSVKEQTELNGLEMGFVAEDNKVTSDESAETQVDETTNAETTAHEQVIPKVVLYQYPPSEHLPSISPFCLKLETFLRMHSIPYENQYGYKMGSNGKLPWIEYKGDKVADSNITIRYLKDKFEIDMDKDLTKEQQALAHVAQRMLEENTYWVLIHDRFVMNYPEYKRLMTPPTGTGIGFNISIKMLQRKMRSQLDSHGLGRHTSEEIVEIGKADLRSLSNMLGEKDYLLGREHSPVDCTIFGVCANILYSGCESPFKEFIMENTKNLFDLCERIKNQYWTDWDKVVVPKVDPVHKRTFTFRRKSAPKTETTEKADTAETDDEVNSTDISAENTESVTDPTATTDEPPAPISEPVAPTNDTPATKDVQPGENIPELVS